MSDLREPHLSDTGETALEEPAARPGGAIGRFGVRTLSTAVRRRRRLFVAVVAVAVGAGALFTAVQVPRYTATAEIVADTAGGAAASPAAIADDAQTDVHILRSRGLAQAVAVALRLDRDPVFNRPPGGIAGLAQRLRDAFGGAPSPASTEAPGISRAIVDRLVGGLSVERLEGTYAQTISYTAPDAPTAARVANEYARQYGSARMSGAPDRPRVRIISEAEAPLTPVSPRPFLNLAIAAAAGLLLALVAAVVAERMFAGLTSTREIEERLGLHHLGSVPMLASVLPAARSPLDAVVEAPMSGFAEAFRSVMMAIRYAGGRGTQVIAITSALPNEGKTTIAACLARTVALGGDAVVLVDCDSRRRDTSALFGKVAMRPGLAEVLRYEATLDEALVRDKASGAWILPLTGPPAELSDLLCGAAMAALVEDLRRRFKRVLIDTAPILPISGTRAIATMADLVVIVVRWRTTADHAVAAALRLLPDKHVRVGGVVLSQVDMRRQVKYGQGDPSFYYEQYSKYYS